MFQDVLVTVLHSLHHKNGQVSSIII